MRRAAADRRRKRPPAYWRSLAQKLSDRYGDPLHGNYADPLDELIYIVLSAKTRLESLKSLFENLKREYPEWADVLKRGKSRFRKAIQPLGLANIRTEQIFSILRRIRKEKAEVSLQFLDGMEDADVERYLTSLPGVGLKTARCVMLYSLGRQTFPADIHTLRLFHYLGVTDRRLRHDTAQDLLQNMVPPKYRFKLHVNIVAHGQETCLPRHPKCRECVLRSVCNHRMDKVSD